ncbi:MAG: hypothetical protein HRT61_01075 [Ekhidna sp.]|nr:hypothetical protein [Ekhidna sp.]
MINAPHPGQVLASTYIFKTNTEDDLWFRHEPYKSTWEATSDINQVVALLNVDPIWLESFLNEETPLIYSVADRLEEVTPYSAEWWMRLQRQYDAVSNEEVLVMPMTAVELIALMAVIEVGAKDISSQFQQPLVSLVERWKNIFEQDLPEEPEFDETIELEVGGFSEILEQADPTLGRRIEGPVAIYGHEDFVEALTNTPEVSDD